jgi:hypothetical protein
VIHDWRRFSLKDKINDLLFSLGSALGVTQLPTWNAISEYQGFGEINSIAAFHSITAPEFFEQAALDYRLIVSRMNETIPLSTELSLPHDLADALVVFPTGTGRQFIPLWWARKHLPDAYYAFFCKDPDLSHFREAGLRTIAYYREPGDITAIAQASRWALTTDSFPSHLLQHATDRATVLLTELPRKRIVTPYFKGRVVEAVAPCHPCPHIERGSPCMAGYAECLNWASSSYTDAVLGSLAV